MAVAPLQSERSPSTVMGAPVRYTFAGGTTAVPVLPAASRAVTVSTFAPACRTIPSAVQLVVPVAVPPPPRALVQVTWVTPRLSDAVPASVNTEELVL